MGQSHTRPISTKYNCILFNKIEDANNGFVLQGKFIPEELLMKILENLDFKSFITCKRVCKQWYLLIQNVIIKKKIETMWHNPPVDEEVLWRYFKAVWGGYIPYDEDLIKFNKECWIFCLRGVSVGSWQNIHDVGLCSTHFIRVDDVPWKQQDIDLTEWFPQYILDTIKPTMIKIWDFYMCKEDRNGKYECKIELIKSKERCLGKKDVIIDSCSFSRTFEKYYEKGKWQKLKRQFIVHEKGLNKIRFYHDFKNGIVGGTTVILQFPCRRKMKKYKPFKIDGNFKRLN